MNRFIISVGLAVVSTAVTSGGLHLYKKLHYHEDGFNDLGYDRDGYDRQGYDKKGYDRNGYDRSGKNAGGYYRDGYNDAAVDVSGFSRKYYKIVCEEMQECLNRANRYSRKGEYRKAEAAIGDGLAAGVKAVIFHWNGAAQLRETLYLNLMLCEVSNLLPAALLAELYDAEGVLGVADETEEAELEADFSCEALVKLAEEVRKFTT